MLALCHQPWSDSGSEDQTRFPGTGRHLGLHPWQGVTRRRHIPFTIYIPVISYHLQFAHLPFWLVVWLPSILSHILGISSQLTHIVQRGGLTTNQHSYVIHLPFIFDSTIMFLIFRQLRACKFDPSGWALWWLGALFGDHEATSLFPQRFEIFWC